MSFKRCFLPLFLALFTVIPLGAATVSFLVIETGLDMEAELNQHSGLWESGLLDVFFESGHIVSNAPVMRLDYLPSDKFPAEAENDLTDALEGGVDYMILALLEYQVHGADAGLSPRNVTLRLFRTRPFEMMYEQKYSASAVKSMKEEYDNLKKTARTLVPRIK